MTLGALVRDVARRLRAAPLHYGHGTANARDEAAFLVLRGLGLPFDAPADRPVSRREHARIESFASRRIRERMPVAYLLGEAWLAGERFHINRRVIIPRSHVAALLQDGLRPWQRRAPRRMLDLCTGSGCLAVLAAKAFPHARIDASDMSIAALEVARRNLRLHGLTRRIELRPSDLFSGLNGLRYDLILCNPPYVTADSMRRLPAEYRHEPRLALAGGRDGLEFVKRLLAEAPRHMTTRGLLVCEVGGGRRALALAYPRMPFTWTPDGAVFVLTREELG
ncbi:MAG: 50S ribosomal protein L3 N(5)-glutamine methyltransferase [Burkholderiales bacterium]